MTLTYLSFLGRGGLREVQVERRLSGAEELIGQIHVGVWAERKGKMAAASLW